ncbi:MAG: Gfo/Idh/MocA family oxidoreductase [Jatrophihabitans sp.]
MRRFDPGYVQLRDTLTVGRVGAALLLHCVHRNVAALDGQDADSAITGSAVHEIDVTRWLLDEEITEVSVLQPRASGSARGQQDPILLLLRTGSGVLVDVEVFLNARYGYDVRCELVGETGTVMLDAPPATSLRSAGQSGRDIPPDWRPRFADAYRLELSNWIAAVTAGQPSDAASSWDGYQATAVAEAGLRALRSGTAESVASRERPAMYR